MRIPQIIYIVLLAMNLGINLVKHGERRIDKYNFFSALLGTVIPVALLCWGGFFRL